MYLQNTNQLHPLFTTSASLTLVHLRIFARASQPVSLFLLLSSVSLSCGSWSRHFKMNINSCHSSALTQWPRSNSKCLPQPKQPSCFPHLSPPHRLLPLLTHSALALQAFSSFLQYNITPLQSRRNKHGCSFCLKPFVPDIFMVPSFISLKSMLKHHPPWPSLTP